MLFRSLIAFAVVQHCLGHHNSDNSWLFTVCDKLLDGARAYIDVIETNPPGAFLIYMPAALVARALGVAIEPVVSICVFAGAFACIVFSGAILRTSGLLRREEETYALNAAVFALIVTPGLSFAEREHLASFLVLPALSIYAARASNAPARLSHAIIAGLLAGVAMSIKPHFCLALGFPILALIGLRKSLWPAFGAENLVATGVVVAFVAATFAFFPGFFDVLPSIVEAYVPVFKPWRVVLANPWFIVNCLLLVVMAIIGGTAVSQVQRYLSIVSM